MGKTTFRVEDFRDFNPVDDGGLQLIVNAGRIRNDNVITDKTGQILALTDNTTNFVEIDTSGVASSNTVSFTTGSIAIALVVTASGDITSLTDKRTWVFVGGGGSGTVDVLSGSGTTDRLTKFVDADTIVDANVAEDGTTGTLTALKAFIGTVVTLSDIANIATDASLGNSFKVTIAGDRTLDAPTNPTEGQLGIWRIKASGADRTLTLDTGAGGFKFGTDVTEITSIVDTKVDLIGARYDLTDNRWEVIAYVKGY